MHEISFAEVVCPARHACLNLPLLDFSIGHRLLLLRQRNPLIWIAEEDFNALPFEEQIMWLIEAVYICAKSYANRLQLERPSFFGWRQRLNWIDVKVWHWRRGRKTDWPLEIAAFRNYIAAQKVITEWKERREGFPFLPCLPADGDKGRALGGPYDAALIQFLINSGLCGSQHAAMEYPFGAAQMHFFTYLEREGALKIINAAEMEFEEYCQEMDAKAAAAGKKTEDGAQSIAPLGRAPTTPNPASGLATPPPDFSDGGPS